MVCSCVKLLAHVHKRKIARHAQSQLLILQMITLKLDSVLLDFSLTVKAATLTFISGCDSAILSIKEGKSDFIYNLLKSN